EFFNGAIAAIRLPARHQLPGALAIAIEPIALIDRTFIPLHTQPPQRGHDLLGVMLPRPLDVGVLDAQQHRAAVASRMEEIENRSTRAADMKKAGRGGSKAELHEGGGV